MDNKNFNKAPHFLLRKTEQEHKLQIVYMELRNFLGMYEYTDCYNYLPDEEDVADYLKIKLTKIPQEEPPKKDDTISKEELPKTGATTVFVGFVICSAIATTIFAIKSKKSDF